MARITRVAKAQQRYAMVPVLNEDGTPKRTPVMRKDGTQKTNKHGRPVFMKVTVADKSKPLPNRKCGKCGIEIEVGQPYKHISPKSGPYGGRTLYRCDSCPSWQVWEYSSSLGARTAQISYEAWEQIDGAESVDDVQSILSATAEEIRGLAGEKRESAENIESGFGHPTEKSDELNQIADDLESWADEVEAADVPETDEHKCPTCDGEGTVDCDECGGSGETGSALVGDHGSCENCAGTGQTECDECEAEEEYVDLDAWRDAVRDAVTIIDECPV